VAQSRKRQSLNALLRATTEDLELDKVQAAPSEASSGGALHADDADAQAGGHGLKARGPTQSPTIPSLAASLGSLASRVPLRILLVDDVAVNLKLFQRYLAVLGYGDSCVTTACDGQQAVSEARRADFDVILMDLHMPRLDGYDASRIIRVQHGTAHPTASPSTNDVLACWRSSESMGDQADSDLDGAFSSGVCQRIPAIVGRCNSLLALISPSPNASYVIASLCC